MDDTTSQFCKLEKTLLQTVINPLFYHWTFYRLYNIKLLVSCHDKVCGKEPFLRDKKTLKYYISCKNSSLKKTKQIYTILPKIKREYLEETAL